MKPDAVVSQSDHTLYCALCTSVVADDAEQCGECGNSPGTQGFPEIQTSPYPFLGKVLDGRYLLSQFLGDGATGYVYRAQAVQINRSFAAKIVDTRRYGKAEFEAELLRRFRLEVEAMSRLRNPHVVAIYEAMQLQDSVFVLLMDFVDGRTLQELLERVGRVKLRRALDLIRQVANGLFEAHHLGFIHRDLKPDNIMIERMPASGFFARILDFGIVHMMNTVDQTQGFRGTPLYASPEQCTGDPSIDHRSDIYSLGCVFFHCVTGQPPFPGTESLRVMDAHVNNDPPRVSDVLTDSVIPPELDDLMGRILAKDPAERPQDLSEVIASLDQLMSIVSSDARAAKAEIAAETEVDRFDLGERMETARLPAVGLGEASSGSTQLVRPLVEFSLPDTVSSDTTAFTATGLNANGTLGVVADQLNRVHVMGMKSDGFFRTYEGARGLITAVHLDDGKVYAAEMDGTVLEWDVDRDGQPRRIGTLSDRVFAIATDERNGLVLCGTERGRVVSVNIASGKQIELVSSGPPISALAKSKNDNTLVCGFWGGGLEVIQLGTKQRQTLESLPSNPTSIVVSDDGYIAAVLDEKHHVRILSLHHGKGFFEIRAKDASLRALAFAEDSQLLGLGVRKTNLHLWDIKNQAAMKALE